MLACVLADFVDGYDTRVIEVGRCCCLLAEPLDLLVIGLFTGLDLFDGDDSVQRNLTCLVDDPHPTAGDFIQKQTDHSPLLEFAVTQTPRGTCVSVHGHSIPDSSNVSSKLVDFEPTSSCPLIPKTGAVHPTPPVSPERVH